MKLIMAADRDEPQIGFRVREKSQKEEFEDSLKDKQKHIASTTAFFQSVMDAVIEVSKKNQTLEWPIELVTKPKK